MLLDHDPSMECVFSYSVWQPARRTSSVHAAPDHDPWRGTSAPRTQIGRVSDRALFGSPIMELVEWVQV